MRRDGWLTGLSGGGWVADGRSNGGAAGSWELAATSATARLVYKQSAACD